MCVICDKKYDDKFEFIDCSGCMIIKEIPYLPNLQYLNCKDTNITEIPYLPNLYYLNCKNTKINNIPVLPNLEELYSDYGKQLYIYL